MSDEDLVRLFQEDRNIGAFHELYERHNEKLSAWITRMLNVSGLSIENSLDKAADISHDTWIRVWEIIDGFEFRSTFSTWIFGIARIMVREHFRQNKISGNRIIDISTIDEHVSVDPVQEEMLILQETAECLVKALNSSLTEQQRKICRLKLMGLSNNDVATELGTTPNVVYVQFHVARKKIAAAMSDCYGYSVHESELKITEIQDLCMDCLISSMDKKEE